MAALAYRDAKILARNLLLRPFFCLTPAEPFFRPDRSTTAPSCRVAVKDGRAFRGHPKGLSLYGAFEVKHLFHGILHFLHPSFLARGRSAFRRAVPCAQRPSHNSNKQGSVRSAMRWSSSRGNSPSTSPARRDRTPAIASTEQVRGLAWRRLAGATGSFAAIVRRRESRSASQIVLASCAPIRELFDSCLPIRLLPTPPTCRVLPGSGVKLCVGRCGDVARGHAHGRSPAWQSSVPTIAARIAVRPSREIYRQFKSRSPNLGSNKIVGHSFGTSKQFAGPKLPHFPLTS